MIIILKSLNLAIFQESQSIFINFLFILFIHQKLFFNHLIDIITHLLILNLSFIMILIDIYLVINLIFYSKNLIKCLID